MKAINLQIQGLSIACKTWGEPQNPPVLALHGWLDNANSFDHLAELFKNKYYFIAVDLPGHGHSSHLPLSSNYHFTDGIFMVIHIINALKLNKVHLLGHSMGACLASLIAGVAPERFLSLSLIEGLGPFSSPAETACHQLSEYVHYITNPTEKKTKGYSKPDSAALARSIKGYVSLDIAKTLSERGIQEIEGEFYWRHDKRLLTPSPLRMTEEQVLSCLNNIKAQTILIWASNGFTFNSELLQGRVKAVKHLKTVQLKGGHHIHMEEPTEVANTILKFYRNIK